MAQVTQPMTAEQKQMEAMRLNAQARAMVLMNAFPVSQQVDAQTFVPSQRHTYDISGNNVGLVTGFTVKVQAKIKNNHATEAMSITDLGVMNLIKNVSFYDPNNQRHIETTGYHIALVNTIKGQKPFGGSAVIDSPVKYGDNYKIIDAPETIAAGATANVVMYYWIPLAYSDTDLSGSVFANVAQSKMRLRLEFATNSTAFILADEPNGLEAIYKGAAAADCVLEEMQYHCFQHYYDQLPQASNGQFIVPALDLSTIYLLENTIQSGLTPNADFKVFYGNLYRYLSTIAIYDNGGVFNKGTDVKKLALQTANYSTYREGDPETWNLETRKLIGTDLPPAIYLAETRNRPIYTAQTGNQSFVFTPTQCNTNARLVMCYESLVTQTNLVNLGTMAIS